MNKTQIIVLGGVLALSAMEASAAVVSAGPGDGTTAATYATTSGNFVVNAFTFTLSKNVSMKYIDSTTAVSVSTANSKGQQIFGGSSNGGGVAPCSSVSVSNPSPNTPTAAGTGCS